MPEGLQVNFTDEESGSQARVLLPAPPGWYKCAIYEIDEKQCSADSKNPGKPMWAITLQCTQDGDHFKRRFWGNVMLFNGALYSFAQLMKAVGREIPKSGGFEVPDPEELIGEEIIASISKVRDTYQMNKEGHDGSVIWKNEIRGYKALDDATLAAIGKAGSGKQSLLP